MSVSFTLDWVSVTLTSKDAMTLMRSGVLGERVIDNKTVPKFGYTGAMRFDTGAIMMWNSAREEMGTHVMLSGSTLLEMGKQGNDSLTVLNSMGGYGGRCSRIDLAIDVKNTEFTFADVDRTARLPYIGKGRTPKYTEIRSDDGGWTVYIGSRSSEKFIRIYDKKVESKSDETSWVRIEIECKGSVAHWLGSELLGKSTEEAYAMACSLINGQVRFSTLAWGNAVSSNRVDLAVPKKSDRDTIGWLVRTAAPALARMAIAKPNENVLAQFYDALNLAIKRLEVHEVQSIEEYDEE